MNLMKMKKCLRSTQLIQKLDKIKNMCKNKIKEKRRRKNEKVKICV